MRSSLCPRLVVAGAAAAIDYYVKAFGAEETERHTGPDGRIVHAELSIGAARLMVKDADETDPAPGTPGVILTLEVPDADAVAQRMVAGGGRVVFPVDDHGYGRMGRVADPFGHVWIIARRAPDVWALTDLRTPWCVHVVATLRIAEHLAAGARPVGDLAAAAGCDAGVLRAVLGHLVGAGVFTEPAPGTFELDDTARALLDSANFLDLEGIGGRMAHAWSTLLTYVRTGRPGYHELFGRPFWEDLAANPELAASFDALMGPAGHGVPDPDVELADGWAGVESIVDVGGGAGALLAEILRARPGLRGTLVDLPGTIARAGATFDGLADRVTLAGQSFFDPLPAGADVYLLAKVLNDWPDEETVAILRRCAEAARPGGRILVLGGVAPDTSRPDLQIEMVLLGGKTSTLTEFRALAARAGLDVTAAGRQSTGRYVVECRPS